MGNEGIVVGVYSLCYNHAKFLRNYLEGVIAQETKFVVKVFIHDDASEDGSKTILKEYENRYPDRFNIIYASENQYSKGVRIRDYIWPLMKECKYVAFCECDDEWIYPYKLQTQFDFMEAHPETMLCYHNAINCYHDGSNRQEPLVNGLDSGFLSDENVILNKNGRFPTCSMMIRTERLLDFPDYARRAPVGDEPLSYWCATNGDIYYFDKVWAIRNYLHEESWNHRFRKDKSMKYRYLFGFMRFLHDHDVFSKGRYSKYISERCSCLVDFGVDLLLEGQDGTVESLRTAVDRFGREFDGAIDTEYEFLKRATACTDYTNYVLETLQAFKGDVYIYGAGKKAIEMKELIDQMQIAFRGFVVSSLENNPFELLGHKVYEIRDIEDEDAVALVLGLNAKNRLLVLDFLKRNNCKAKLL